jgi:DNA-binding MarR family transcriptional regulator
MSDFESPVRQRDRHYIRKVADQYRNEYPWLDQRALELTLALNACYKTMDVAHQRETYANGLGHTIGRLALLRVLYFSGAEALSQARIGKELRVAPSSVTSMVTGLEKDGMISRVINENDRRTIFVSLTDEGREMTKRLLPLMPKASKDVWSVLSEAEQKTLLDLLLKFLDGGPIEAGVP